VFRWQFIKTDFYLDSLEMLVLLLFASFSTVYISPGIIQL